ncbi:DNA alkylation repair protein [Catellatospora vulcania]|uniref:DNA alkylation repair protein n=1 Tax=Catellatospora vulcania TaxID=1460450 RepID=UPI0012D4BD52|nr:DNA alkylation repair protein [Catellatospora vulcania]
MADLKDQINEVSLDRLAAAITRVHPAFPAREFTAAAHAGLGDLPLKQRVSVVSAQLAAHLPQPFPVAAHVLRDTVAATPLDMWSAWPATDYVAVHGLGHPDDALATLAALTPHATAEFAIRPYLAAHPERTLAQLHDWAVDPDQHLRRLASEGSRPRLPWASRVPMLADPQVTLPVLDRLHDDPELYVRRSVANHLNDITKDHPDVALATARRWAAGGGDGTAWVIRHALRSLVKQGHPEALGLLGFDHGANVAVTGFTVTPGSLPIGGQVTIAFTLTADTTVRAAVDYVVHHAGARGPRGPKVFKLTTATLEPGLPRQVTRRHTFQHVSVRQLYPGPHRIDIQVNGRVLAGTEIVLHDGH